MDYLTGFLTMVESYEEIAALRMRKVKNPFWTEGISWKV